MDRIPLAIRGRIPAEPRGHVLIVEDNRDIRESLDELLKVEGYRTGLAEHGRAALRYLEAGLLPTAILLDLMMPEMSGWEFLEAIGDTAFASIPILVLTGVFDSGHTETLPAQFGCQVFKKAGGLEPVLDALSRICEAAGVRSPAATSEQDG